MARCENVRGCDRPATNSVPMFMGSVWMCARCSVEFEQSATIREPEIRKGDYVRIPDLGSVAGRVSRITLTGLLVLEYWADGEMHIAFRTRDSVSLVA